jgi:glycosyltransferase involved in cell wall biosynthesis
MLVANVFSKLEFVHVVESFSGGTMSAAVTLINEQVAMGSNCELIYLERKESLDSHSIRQLLPLECKIKSLGNSTPWGLIKLISQLTREIRSLRSNRIYHLHSSWAGLIGKVVLGRTRKSNLFYTPHGFSFIREDIGHFKKKIFFLIEYITNKVSYVDLICTSQYEKSLANKAGKSNSRVLLNSVDTVHLLKLRQEVYSGWSATPRVGTLGRITMAKNPERFARLSQLLDSRVKMKWIGDGERELFKTVNSDLFEVTGWLNPTEALTALANLDIFVLLSDWESFPFCVIEAQSMGIPCIIWNFPSAHELVQSGTDGFIASNLSEISKIIDKLLTEVGLVDQIKVNAINKAKTVYSLTKFRENMVLAYNLNEKYSLSE